MSKPGSRAVVVLLLVVAGPALSGCASITGDPVQKQTVSDTLNALPHELDDALGLGKIRLHVYNPEASDVGGDRQAQLSVPEPLAGITLGQRVSGCQAMVAALAPTSVRMYGRLPGGRDWYEATGPLCQRGIGEPLATELDDAIATGPDLRLALPQRNGTATDTAVNFDPDALTIETYGFGWRPRGASLPVTTPRLAALDRGLQVTALPWRYRNDPARPGSSAAARLRFLVPAGTRLQVRAVCGRPQPDWHLQLDPRTEGNYLGGGGGAPFVFAGPDEKEREACDRTLVRPLMPQLRYQDAAGDSMDRFDVIVMAGTDDTVIRSIRIDRITV